MGNIQDLLAQILSARYGRDVRQSIHDAIETCYEDGHAGAIDLQAREDIAAETTAREALDSRVEALENDTTTAEEVTFDDTDTQLGATDVQGAIGAISNNLETLFSGITYTGNIDNIDKTSFVWVDFSVVTGTLPKTAGYGIICTFRISSFIFLQVVFDYYSASGTPIIRYRMYANNQWYRWTQFTGTLSNA